jgi:hypothetical protein
VFGTLERRNIGLARPPLGRSNERDFPHLVELALPLGSFRSVVLEIDGFHREGRIPVRRGRDFASFLVVHDGPEREVL